MSTLAEIFEHLTNGEFAHSAIVDFEPDQYESTIDPRRYAQVISHINAALRALHTQFWLSTGDIVLQPVVDRELYALHSRHAISNTESTAEKWIMDSAAEPFTDNILSIEEIYDEGGNKLPLNRLDMAPEYQYFTPSAAPWTLQVPYPVPQNQIAIMFRAGHKKVEFEVGMDPAAVDVPVPYQLVEALGYFVAHRHFSSLDFDGGQQGASYYQKYMAQVAMVENQGLFIEPPANDHRFDCGGWV